MSQTILIQSDEDLKKIYTINLQTYANTNVITRNNAEDTTALLQILPTVDLIITDEKVGNEKTFESIMNFQKQANLIIPVIVMGSAGKFKDEAIELDRDANWNLLIKESCKVLGVTPNTPQNEATADYFPVATYYFYEIDHTPCDVYIKIIKSAHDIQYVKRLHAQDSFSRKDIEKYEAQGLTEFHIPKDYQQYFVTFVTNGLIKRLEQNQLPLVDRLVATANSYDIVADHIQQFGLDRSIIELAESSIDSMITTVKEAPKLANLLKMLFASKVSYAYQRAHLVTVIGEFILSKQSWYETKFLDIFTFVSFFSDITLKSIEQIRINSNDELKFSGLSEEEKNQVKNHAKDASALIKEHPSHTKDLENLIKQHHGANDGIGFPNSANDDIHPLSKIFIVADAFVKMILDPNGPKNKKDIVKILYTQYESPSYEKIIHVLEQKID